MRAAFTIKKSHKTKTKTKIAFAVFDYLVDVLTQIELPPCTAVERLLCRFSSDNFEHYKCNIHELF